MAHLVRWFTHEKWWFSSYIAMLNHQMVSSIIIHKKKKNIPNTIQYPIDAPSICSSRRPAMRTERTTPRAVAIVDFPIQHGDFP